MTTLVDRAQRWRDQRSSFVVPDRVFAPRKHDVALISDDATPKAFVQTHHYEGTWPACVHRVGLYRRSSLVGVAADTMRILPDGRTFDNRAATKIRKLETGWEYAAAKLERFGATPLTDVDRRHEWLDYWVARLCRQTRHPGKHKYIWALDPRLRRHLPASQPYPKQIDAERSWTPARPSRPNSNRRKTQCRIYPRSRA
jgi:hypothetical protein